MESHLGTAYDDFAFGSGVGGDDVPMFMNSPLCPMPPAPAASASMPLSHYDVPGPLSSPLLSGVPPQPSPPAPVSTTTAPAVSVNSNVAASTSGGVGVQINCSVLGTGSSSAGPLPLAGDDTFLATSAPESLPFFFGGASATLDMCTEQGGAMFGDAPGADSGTLFGVAQPPGPGTLFAPYDAPPAPGAPPADSAPMFSDFCDVFGSATTAATSATTTTPATAVAAVATEMATTKPAPSSITKEVDGQGTNGSDADALASEITRSLELDTASQDSAGAEADGFEDDGDLDAGDDDELGADDDDADSAASEGSGGGADSAGALASPATTSPVVAHTPPASPSETVLVGGRSRHVSMDVVRSLVHDFQALLLLRARDDASTAAAQAGAGTTSNTRTKTGSGSLGYKLAPLIQLLLTFYGEHMARLPRVTQICAAYAMLRGEYTEERYAGVLVLAKNARSLTEAHLRELAALVDARVRDWVACDLLAGKVLFPVMRRDAKLVAPVLAWKDAPSPWRQRCCCVAFTKLLHITGAAHASAAAALCDTCLGKPERTPSEVLAALVQELAAASPALAVTALRRHAAALGPERLSLLTEQLDPALRAQLADLHHGGVGSGGGATTPSQISSSTGAATTGTTGNNSSVLPSTLLVPPTMSSNVAASTVGKNNASTIVPQQSQQQQQQSLAFETTGILVPNRAASTSIATTSTGGGIATTTATRRKKRTTKTKGASDGPLLIAPSPSVSPAPGSPDLAAPVPVAATQPLRRTHSLGRFGRDSLGALGPDVLVPAPSRTPAAPHTSLTPALAAMGLATTPTKKRTRAPYRTNLSTALLTQNPTSATLAAAVAASAAAANLDRCAPALGLRQQSAPLSSGAAASGAGGAHAPQQFGLQQQQMQMQMQQQQGHYFGGGGRSAQQQQQIQMQMQLQMQQQLRAAKSVPVQQMFGAQKKQGAPQQLAHHFGHARSTTPFGGSSASLASLQQQLAQQNLRSGARLLAGAQQQPGHFVRPVSPKRK